MAAAQKKPVGTAKMTAPRTSTAAKKTQSAAAGKAQNVNKASSAKPAAARSSASKGSSRKTTEVKTNKKTTAAKGYSSSAKRKKNHSKNQVQVDYTILKDIAVIAVFVFCVILQLSCFFTGGGLMQLLHTYNFRWFGVMAYFMPLILFLLPCFIISNWHNSGLIQKVAASILLFLSIETILSIVYETSNIFTVGGGLVGHTLFGVLYRAFGIIGSFVIMIACLFISVVLFFGHSVVTQLQQNSKNAYRAVYSHHKLQQGRRKIRAQEKRLHREQEENEQLKMQRMRLENLQKQRQEILEKKNINREFVNIQLEESKKQEALNRELLKEQGSQGKRELRTNTELEEEDRSMKEVVLGKEEQKSAEDTNKVTQPSMFIEGEEITTPLRLDTSNILEEEPQKHDDGWVLEPDDEENEENDLEFDDISENIINKAMESSSDTESSENMSSENASFENVSSENVSSDTVLTDVADETEEDISGASAAGDESVDYRMLMRDTKNTGKHDEDESVYTKTVRTATGKVITVELDGLPGENKRPKDSAKIKERLDQYDEKVVPIANDKQKKYIFPSTDLLTPGTASGKGREELARSMQKKTAYKLQRTLQNFGVGVTITNISGGPSVTRYELQPEQGVKVSKIVNLADDIKLNLAAEDIRIEAPIPGKAAIGIEVPNKEKQMVAFRDLLESDEFKKAKSKTIFAAGKDIAGKTVVADIEKMPHLLIAGQTGSGKSVCINTIIMSILYKASPSDVKLIMIDPKVVELSVYNGIPHLLIPVVTDPKKAAAALNWAVNEMEERYKKFAEHKARNIIGYNAQIDQIEDVPGKDRPEKIPQIIVIVDELADLMMTAGTDVEDAIQKLAQKARAAGIHLIIATQRPSVNVITGVIKANIPSRIAFSVASGIDSRTILDETGAEKLLGKGDMLFHPYYISKPVRVQGAFVSDDEVMKVVNFLTQQKNVIGGEINTNIDLQANMPGNSLPGGDQDELFETAGRFIIEQEKASIGNLQRHLRIGFNRAARIMDQLYAAGVVSKDEGTKPRKVLMKAEEFEEYLQSR
ncbi:MAG: DNA translocase FtsK 4TM domain-containing protein [Lachnospiraceae bacterium]|nr:DNA translocase FtsK 4TM domain-containing protein [Lachnospiraceae bacterium]